MSIDFTKPIQLKKPAKHGDRVTFEDYSGNMSLIEEYLNAYIKSGIKVFDADRFIDFFKVQIQDLPTSTKEYAVLPTTDQVIALFHELYGLSIEVKTLYRSDYDFNGLLPSAAELNRIYFDDFAEGLEVVALDSGETVYLKNNPQYDNEIKMTADAGVLYTTTAGTTSVAIFKDNTWSIDRSKETLKDELVNLEGVVSTLDSTKQDRSIILLSKETTVEASIQEAYERLSSLGNDVANRYTKAETYSKSVIDGNDKAIQDQLDGFTNSVQSSFTNTNKQVSDLAGSVGTTSSAIANLKSQVDPAIADISGLKESVTHISNNISGITNDVTALSDNVDDLALDISGHDIKLGEHDSKFNTIDVDLGLVKEKNKAQDNKLIELEEKLLPLPGRILSVEQLNATQTQRLDAVEIKATNAETSANDYAANKADFVRVSDIASSILNTVDIAFTESGTNVIATLPVAATAGMVTGKLVRMKLTRTNVSPNKVNYLEDDLDNNTITQNTLALEGTSYECTASLETNVLTIIGLAQAQRTVLVTNYRLVQLEQTSSQAGVSIDATARSAAQAADQKAVAAQTDASLALSKVNAIDLTPITTGVANNKAAIDVLKGTVGDATTGLVKEVGLKQTSAVSGTNYSSTTVATALDEIASATATNKAAIATNTASITGKLSKPATGTAATARFLVGGDGTLVSYTVPDVSGQITAATSGLQPQTLSAPITGVTATTVEGAITELHSSISTNAASIAAIPATVTAAKAAAIDAAAADATAKVALKANANLKVHNSTGADVDLSTMDGTTDDKKLTTVAYSDTVYATKSSVTAANAATDTKLALKANGNLKVQSISGQQVDLSGMDGSIDDKLLPSLKFIEGTFETIANVNTKIATKQDTLTKTITLHFDDNTTEDIKVG